MRTQNLQNFILWIEVPQISDGKVGYVSIYIWRNRQVWLVVFKNTFRICRVPGQMPNLQCSF